MRKTIFLLFIVLYYRLFYLRRSVRLSLSATVPMKTGPWPILLMMEYKNRIIAVSLFSAKSI